MIHDEVPAIALTFMTEPETRKTFPSAETQRSFITYEQKCCVKYYRALCQAHSLPERKAARIALAKAQLRAYERWKELATVAVATGPQRLA